MVITKRWISALFIIMALIFFAGGCGDDNGKYEGASNLMVERNRARLAASKGEKPSSDTQTRPSTSLKSSKSSNKTLLEEEVNVVSATSGKRLATGTAYIDHKGKIITIRIKNK